MDTRIFVGKEKNYDAEALLLERELREDLGIEGLTGLIKYRIYDVFGVQEGDRSLLEDIFLNSTRDKVMYEVDKGEFFLARENLPVQFDQAGDAAEEIFYIRTGRKIEIHSGELFVFKGNLSKEDLESIKAYMINPVEMRVKDLGQFLVPKIEEVLETPTFNGFIDYSDEELQAFHKDQGLAMAFEDLAYIQEYFIKEDRDPTETEILVLDTYWSDHCRHTTFETEITKLEVQEGLFKERIEKAFEAYLETKDQAGRGDRARTLMDMATVVGSYFRKTGELADQEVSSEINACSVHIEVEEDGVKKPWLLMFKNETHNHPTEIEPYGGAGTCLGGAIRDPLSGRAYVYQAMRLTGAGDITQDLSQTLEGKLPQAYISKRASDGYSDYANQIGSAATYVREFYHPGFIAKRMELGAVVGATPLENVTRKEPVAGDVVLYLGGKTGRDGVGGATGSSVEHDEKTEVRASSEVQKGNPPPEKKIMRLFTNPEFSVLIKKSNDFGAGGVSVAIGELAEGMDICLDSVPVKYPGLNGTELAISESQERVAIVVAAEDMEKAQKLALEEDLEAIKVADITDSGRLVVNFQGRKIVDISRAFLDTNGIRQSQEVSIDSKARGDNPFELGLGIEVNRENILANLGHLNTAMQKGMVEKFDFSAGRSTVLAPFGGKYRLTENDASVQKLPTKGYTETVSAMTSGYSPFVASYSPYLGGAFSVVEALAKLVAVGIPYDKARLTNQEYFGRLDKDQERWGEPAAALLGLVEAQLAFKTPAIGGKDSMSGTFNDLHVPPTLVTFAVKTAQVEELISPELKGPETKLYLWKPSVREDYSPIYQDIRAGFEEISREISSGNIISAKVLGFGGISETLAKMSFGNKCGFEIETKENIFNALPGAMILEAVDQLGEGFIHLGRTNSGQSMVFNGIELSIDEAIEESMALFEDIYPTSVEVEEDIFKGQTPEGCKTELAGKKALIPVVPGTTGERDMAKALRSIGVQVEEYIFKTTSPELVEESYIKLAAKLEQVDILAMTGSSDLGNEPNGGAKVLAAILKDHRVREAVEGLRERKGLIIGVDGGFKALLDTGILLGEVDVSIEKNAIGRHLSSLVETVVLSDSPWAGVEGLGDSGLVPLSTSEARLVMEDAVAKDLRERGLVYSVYAQPNSAGSAYGIEGLVSEDGLVLGRMTHPERMEEGLYINR